MNASIAAPLACLALLLCSNAAGAQTAYVSNEKDNTLSIIDAASMTVIDTVKVGRQPRGIVLSPDNTRLYICASSDDTIQVFDVAHPQGDPQPALRRGPGNLLRSPPMASGCTSPTRTAAASR